MTIQTILKVAGVEFRDQTKIQLVKSIGDNNSSCRLNAQIPNTNGRHNNDFTEGDQVQLLADTSEPPTTLIFTGILTQITHRGKGANDEITLMVRDYTSLLQRTSITPEVYTNTEISVIVDDILTKYASTAITRNNINVTGITLDRIQFKQTTLFEALKQLAELSKNFYFYVDANKDFHFEQKSSVSSGVTLDSTNVIKSQFKSDVDSVFNRVFVYGKRQLVKAPQESFTSDGTGSVFTLSNEPHNTQVIASGIEQVGGILNVSNSQVSGVNYLVDFFNKQFVFTSGQAIGYDSLPPSGSVITCDYQTTRPIIKFADDATSIATYDMRTKVIIDDNIEDARTARDVAKNQVLLNKEPKVEGTLNLQGISSLTPGNTVIVNIPSQNVVLQTYEILEVRYDFTTKNVENDTVITVRVSERISNLTDVLAEMLTDVKRLQAAEIDTTGIISRLQISTGSFGIGSVSAGNVMWKVKTRLVESSFILGITTLGSMHNYNSKIMLDKGTSDTNVDHTNNGLVFGAI
jgi:hypothetical protein